MIKINYVQYNTKEERGIFLKKITSECPGLPGLIFFTINTTPAEASKKI